MGMRRDGHRPELLHVTKNDKRSKGIDMDIGDSEISEVLEAREPDASEPTEAVNASEGVERGNEIGREVDRGYGI
ncbi:hypothetical protein Pyn_00653 [Prunus yedoensis var. nudiflora]|uniref:Uncharacterized protein n=1 Tax=Prunus yedoensis var. nudiflora TaxID=2094558 RepID=A0A314ZKS7_PRUYE|nr:hypothetical protein Pyn_00653 [Prunus yedoensis var. nudiflora]